jgi:hypothetical protein
MVSVTDPYTSEYNAVPIFWENVRQKGEEDIQIPW